jgi:hypothetical protein
MTTENLVDAALAGFDAGEAVTLPSVHYVALWTAYDEARDALFGATQVGSPALRYAQAMWVGSEANRFDQRWRIVANGDLSALRAFPQTDEGSG